MRKNESPTGRSFGLFVFLLMLALAGLLGLAGCGGGSSSTPTRPGGGGGGGGGGTEAPACIFTPPGAGGSSSGAGAGNKINSQYFGMHLNSISAPWPYFVVNGQESALPFGAQRLWAAGVAWSQIDTAQGAALDTTLLDEWLADPGQNGTSVNFLFTLARTPTWASQQPNDNSCTDGPGACDPPLDLNSDGSGADDVWIAWVTALAQHSAAQKNAGLPGISYYEIWNEWNASNYWNPTYSSTAQLVRMEQDARCVVEGPPSGKQCYPNITFPGGTAIDPTAQIVSPSPVGAHTRLDAVANNLGTYFSTKVNGYAGGDFSDVIGFHGYVGTATKVGSSPALCPTPEDVNTVIADMNSVFSQYGVSKPMFNTEGSWSEADVEGFTDQDRQAAFLPRYLMLQESNAVNRVYWFAWDSNKLSSLYNDSSGQATLAATADGEVNAWTNGATVSQACSATSGSSTVWTCGFTRSGGYSALAVWDTSQDCTTSSCPTTTFTVPAGGYIEYRDVAGNVTSLNGASSVPIGAKPILLETSALR